ncbi:hypothetical protein WPS_34510 [Vulcanimicrobium alpinum]|uniref:Uncharacterized protein n=1 Tax=Vulcanimicrobium alpinum TaxID=3016050 RepID=A0AAN2CAZ8_UNVUL|nr:hypothetical protein [Vulcanimicrobium alpinum]BDE08175.1 hypothetical protein WPS_34510 [Vulcanimicrobium alpinum]
MIDRQTLGNIVPLAAVVIALAEWLLDHTYPRYASPWFWLALIATIGLLVLVQVLRFTGAPKRPPAKPDYSATSIIRRRVDPDDQG